jgi:putative phosphoserine phosphatase/1-acylglycerol-3-phosphate O-acyltransferase
VDVAVFPPISVSDWTVDTLSDRIAEVRQLYVDALADWPVDELPEHDVYRKKPAPRKAPRKAAAKAVKAAPAKTAAKKAVAKKTTAKKATKGVQPPATKAQKSTPRPKGRS